MRAASRGVNPGVNERSWPSVGQVVTSEARSNERPRRWPAERWFFERRFPRAEGPVEFSPHRETLADTEPVRGVFSGGAARAVLAQLDDVERGSSRRLHRECRVGDTNARIIASFLPGISTLPPNHPPIFCPSPAPQSHSPTIFPFAHPSSPNPSSLIPFSSPLSPLYCFSPGGLADWRDGAALCGTWRLVCA